jgi:uncharacterized protein YdeI (YjbR/CyaY-like superfamily)
MPKAFEIHDLTHFADAEAFGRWLAKHHADRDELWVGFHKVGSGIPSLTWPQSVDEALCVGWIDGIRKRVDDTSYCIRFTPRKRSSIWSSVNIARIKVLGDEGRMLPAGLAAFAARSEEKSSVYAYEVRRGELEEPFAGLLKKQRKANAFFESQPAWYRRNACHWVMSAKREQTRRSRFDRLIAHCRSETTLPQFTRTPAAAAKSTRPKSTKAVDNTRRQRA